MASPRLAPRRLAFATTDCKRRGVRQESAPDGSVWNLLRQALDTCGAVHNTGGAAIDCGLTEEEACPDCPRSPRPGSRGPVRSPGPRPRRLCRRRRSGGGGGDDDAIVIGTSLPLTGEFSQPGQAAEQGYEVWKEMVNESGGLLDRDVELVDQGRRVQPEHHRRRLQRADQPGQGRPPPRDLLLAAQPARLRGRRAQPDALRRAGRRLARTCSAAATSTSSSPSSRRPTSRAWSSRTGSPTCPRTSGRRPRRTRRSTTRSPRPTSRASRRSSRRPASRRSTRRPTRSTPRTSTPSSTR